MYRHFYMTLVHIFKGRNSILCTFVEGKFHKGNTYTKGVKTFLFKKILFCFVLLYVCFLVLLYGALSYI